MSFQMEIRNTLFVSLTGFFFLLISFAHSNVSAQSDSLFVARLDTLQKLSLRIVDSADNELRLEANAIFQESFRVELLADSIFYKDFSSIRTVSVLVCPNKTFRIATWYVPFRDGTFRFFGYVQTPHSSSQLSAIMELHDNTAAINRSEDKPLNPENWFGAFYYELIHVAYRRRDFYVLLGWKGNDRNTRMRVIEPFELVNGRPVFGAPVFQMPGRSPKRIIFEYSSRASMGLHYYPEFRFERVRRKAPAIVFDRLIPMQPDLRGSFQFYVPEVNIFDAFRFYRGRWEWVEDVDVRVFVNPALQPLNPPN